MKTQKVFFAGISEGKIGQPEKTACGDVCPSQIISTCRMNFWFVSADILGPTLATKLIWKVTTPLKKFFRRSESAKIPYFQRFLVRCSMHHFQNFHQSCLWLEIFFTKCCTVIKLFPTYPSVFEKGLRYLQNLSTTSRAHCRRAWSQFSAKSANLKKLPVATFVLPKSYLRVVWTSGSFLRISWDLHLLLN